MNACTSLHDLIIYNKGKCPMCKLQDEVQTLIDEVQSLTHESKHLQSMLKDALRTKKEK